MSDQDDFHMAATLTAPPGRVTCDECYRAITPGEQYTGHAGQWEGEPWRSVACQHCEVFRKLCIAITTPGEWYYAALAEQGLNEPHWGNRDHPHYVTWLRWIVGFRCQWRHTDGTLWAPLALPSSATEATA